MSTRSIRTPIPYLLCLPLLLMHAGVSHAVPVLAGGQPGILEVNRAGECSVRITLRPESHKDPFPDTPVLPEADKRSPSFTPPLSLRSIDKPVKVKVAGLDVEVLPDPLRVTVSGEDGKVIQSIQLEKDGSVSFPLDDQPVLGMGEGGPKPPDGSNWRELPVEFDRRGRADTMLPRWQNGAYGSRNPVPLMIGTGGWAIYFNAPWGGIYLTDSARGRFTPLPPGDPGKTRQDLKNQHAALGKGIPPANSHVPGMLDVFIFDARQPRKFMRDLSTVSGPAVMPPKWALGYMQSHRTLEDDAQMISIVDTFRQKHIPVDAVIYLGTGFTPRGWNKPQPSFDFNPEVIKRDPAQVISDMHERHVKVVLHMVPWDRDRLPTLQGSIPPQAGEKTDASHIASYWKQHEPLVRTGVDGWWPDEGDWFDLHERMKRHQLYYGGPLSTEPDKRPWSLHRNGHLGVARWGGWIWSGDTDSSWKTLEAQIAVGINHSLSIGPYWGSDIGGFFSNPELTGELYARWFQFGAFCPSFRSHGRTWWTRLPWGWGLDKLGPVEDKTPPSLEELNNPAIEPVVRRYAELRYRLLSYNYTLAWQARASGLPFMRALWLHYPEDSRARAIGDEYLWGSDLLVAPVFKKGATEREVYLPAGRWVDFWTGKTVEGGTTVKRPVDLATMPIYARAGAILPLDPVRQYTAEKTDEPLVMRIYRGDNGSYTLYEDDGISQAYLKDVAELTRFEWDDAGSKLQISPVRERRTAVSQKRLFRVETIPDGKTLDVEYSGEPVTASLPPR